MRNSGQQQFPSNGAGQNYIEAVKAIKQAILQSRYKAAVLVNSEMLSLYFGVGKYVSQNSRNSFWGTNAIETISNQLQNELPGLRGFSASSIKRMRSFYEEWVSVLNRPLPMGNLQEAKYLNRQLVTDDSQISINELLTFRPSINDDYKQFIDTTYRGSNPERIEWGFQEDKQFRIPIEIIKTNELLNSKIRNNSSIIRYLKYGNISILFAGDLEYNGWNWLAQNNNDFVQTVKEGIDILIAPHHGHKSGFPKSLFDLCGSVRVVIHSKGSEGNIEGTNVSTQYNVYTTGIEYQTLNNKLFYSANILTTRSNGTIYFKINSDGTLKFWTTKASCNHKQIK